MAVQTKSPTNQGFAKSDYVLPYLLLNQTVSDAFNLGKAPAGAIIRSGSFTVYGNEKEAAELIFLGDLQQKWVYEQKAIGSNRFKYKFTIERNASNEHLPWKFLGNDKGEEVPPGTPGATEWNRIKMLAGLAISLKDLKSELEEIKKVEEGGLPDPNNSMMPMLVTFRGSSKFKSGRDILTFNLRLAKFPTVKLWQYVLPLKSKLVSNGDNTYYSLEMDANSAKPLPKEYHAAVKDWADRMAQTDNIKFEDGAFEETEDAPPAREVRNYAPRS